MRNPGEGSSASTTWSGIRVSAVTALLLGTSIPSMVFAQTIAEAPAASDDSTGLQDIVVTARRKEERLRDVPIRSEEHTSELQSLMRTSYAVLCLKKKKRRRTQTKHR